MLHRFWSSVELTGNQTLKLNCMIRWQFWSGVELTGNQTTNEGNEDGFDETCVALEKRRRPGEVFVVVSSNGVVNVLEDK